jgi:hypothetical protein
VFTCSTGGKRTEKAQKAAKARWDKKLLKQHDDATSNAQALPQPDSSNAPSPNPSPQPLPSPSPNPSPARTDGIENRGGLLVQCVGADEIPSAEIMEAFNKFCPDFPAARELTSIRRFRIRKLYLKYKDHEDGPLHFFDTLFKKAQASDKLAGRAGKARWCTFDWIIDEDNSVTIIEGQHDNTKKKTGGLTGDFARKLSQKNNDAK